MPSSLGGVYETGTISVANGDTTVTVGGGGNWASILQGDTMEAEGFRGRIESVTSPGFTTAELYQPWAGPTLVDDPYIVYKDSWLRMDAAMLNANVQDLLDRIRADAVPWRVPEDMDEPDPSWGEDGHIAIKFSTLEWWLHEDDEWVLQGSFTGPQGDIGPPGFDGDDGWSPVLAIVADGARRVVQVTDWVGGSGLPPDTGYIGTTGIVAAIGDAADIGTGGRELLGADRTYYVRTDGSDSNTGLANTAGGAFLTIQKAIDVVFKTLDLGGFNVDIQLADGTYTSGVLVEGPQVGAGVVTIRGNAGTPANVIISRTGGNDVSVSGGASLKIKDVELRTTTSGHCLQATTNGRIAYSNVRFGACALAHVRAFDGGRITCEGNYSIVGSALWHWSISQTASLRVQNRTVTLTGTPNFSEHFAFTVELGVLIASGNTYSGAATGSRYFVSMNGTINSGTTLPGNVAGTTATGGQYV